jgi:hypothetical protein
MVSEGYKNSASSVNGSLVQQIKGRFIKIYVILFGPETNRR